MEHRYGAPAEAALTWAPRSPATSKGQSVPLARAAHPDPLGVHFRKPGEEVESSQSVHVETAVAIVIPVGDVVSEEPRIAGVEDRVAAELPSGGRREHGVTHRRQLAGKWRLAGVARHDEQPGQRIGRPARTAIPAGDPQAAVAAIVRLEHFYLGRRPHRHRLQLGVEGDIVRPCQGILPERVEVRRLLDAALPPLRTYVTHAIDSLFSGRGIGVAIRLARTRARQVYTTPARARSISSRRPPRRMSARSCATSGGSAR